MAAFVIIPTASEAALAAAIAEKFPGKHYKMPKGEFVVAFSGTSKELSDQLGITEGTIGQGLVASISGYFGRAPNDLWEWLKQNWTT